MVKKGTPLHVPYEFINICLERARRRAAKLSQDAISYGMIRVVDGKGRPIYTFRAGGGLVDRD